MSNEQTIWSFLIGKIGNAYGAAGLMGNLYAESGLNPINLENAYEKKLGYTDSTYTDAVDSGKYTNFVRDSAGYGLAQWTYWSRKQKLLLFAKNRGVSIGNLEMQLDFLWKELNDSYPAVVTALKTATSVRGASDAVMVKFENPKDQSETAKSNRAKIGQTYYDKYSNMEKGSVNTMTETEARSILVSAAKSYLGFSEASGKHKKIIDLYNSVTPLPRSYKVTYTDAWCATFVSAMAIQCGMTGIIPRECSCYYQVEAFKKLGEWCENDAYTPKPGDIIYYDWQDSGSGDNTGVPDHVGIVESVSGSSITVIEGNKNDSVERRTIAVNGRYIRGYGLPNYSAWAKKHTKEETKVSEKWYEKSGEWAEAKKLGITDGTRPDDTATRAEVAAMILRGMKLIAEKCGVKL